MKRKMLCVMLTIILVMSTGCALATDRVNDAGGISQDRLVGIVVTAEYLDLFDMEAYLEDNLDDIMAGREPDQSGYQGRIYAEEVVEESTTEDGVPCTTKYYNFDHVDGIPLLHYLVCTYLEDGTLLAEFTTGTCGEGMWDVKIGTELTEGTVYYPSDGGEAFAYVNPVFQDSEGRLYLVAGDGMHISEYVGEMSMNYQEEVTETLDGEENTRQAKFEVTIKRVEVSERVVIVQMNGENQAVSRVEYAPEQLPETLPVSPECAYLIAEQWADGAVVRQMLQPEDEALTVYVRSDKAYCLGRRTEILWPEQ